MQHELNASQLHENVLCYANENRYSNETNGRPAATTRANHWFITHRNWHKTFWMSAKRDFSFNIFLNGIRHNKIDKFSDSFFFWLFCIFQWLNFRVTRIARNSFILFSFLLLFFNWFNSQWRWIGLLLVYTQQYIQLHAHFETNAIIQVAFSLLYFNVFACDCVFHLVKARAHQHFKKHGQKNYTEIT